MIFRKALIMVFAISLLGTVTYFWILPTPLKHSPDISLLTIDGKELHLAEMRGNPLLVTFWSTSCGSCVREIPHLIELYNELAPQGLQLIAISMHYDPPNRVLALQRQRKIPYPVAMDIHADASRAFGEIRMTPTSFLIAPNGRIAYHRAGTMDLNKLRQDILAMLNKSHTG